MEDYKRVKTTVDIKRADPPVGAGILQLEGDRYLQQFVGLREINKLVDASEDMQKRMFGRTQPELVLNAEDFEQFKMFTTEFAKGMAASLKGELHDPRSGDPVALPEVGPEGFSIGIESPEVAAAFADFMSRGITFFMAPKRSEIIAQSLIANAVSAFEVLMGAVAKEVFKINKAALEKTDHEFTLEELVNYDSIEEARNELINRRIEALLMKSVDEWSKWCEKTLQFGLPALSSDWAVIREVFARRNIIVHNGSVINRRYLNIVKDCEIDLPPNATIGTQVVTSIDYVNSAIQLVLSLGLSLIFSTWKKLYPKTASDAVEWLVSVQKFMLYEEMWQAVEEITARLRASRTQRSTQCMTMVYGWVARRELYGAESIREEVEQWDVSGLATAYRIYKQLLISDLEGADRLIKANENNPPFTKYELSVDPVFTELRAAGLVELGPSAARENPSPDS